MLLLSILSVSQPKSVQFPSKKREIIIIKLNNLRLLIGTDLCSHT